MWVGFVLIIFSTPTFAHKNHGKPKPTPTATQSPTPFPSENLEPTIEPEVSQDDMDMSDIEIKTEDPPELEANIVWSEVLFEHLHNKLVHFPFALGLAGALFSLLAFKKEKYWSSARILLTTATLFALPVFLTGRSQKEPFEGHSLSYIVELHEYIGIAALVVLAGMTMWSYKKEVNKLYILGSFLLITLLLTTGLLGGVLGHSG